MKRQNGFVTAAAFVIAAAILIVFSAVYFYLRQSTRQSVVMDFNDRSVGIVETGIREAINILRANPDLIYLDKNIPNLSTSNPTDLIPASDGRDGATDVDKFYTIYSMKYPMQVKNDAGCRIGQYAIRAKVISNWDNIFNISGTSNKLVGVPIYHIISEGWSISMNAECTKVLKQDQGATGHAYVYMPNVGNYYAAIKGLLQVGPGADLVGARVYGRTLEFLDLDQVQPTGPKPPINLDGADYYDTFSPSNWDSAVAAKVPIVNGIGPYKQPNKMEIPLVFPSVTAQVDYYAADTPAAAKNCDFTAAKWKDISPPSSMAGTGIAGLPTGINRDHAYYCNGPTLSIGNSGWTTYIHGQVIMAAEQEIQILGDIEYVDDQGLKTDGAFSPPETGSSEPKSTANQLVLFSKTDVKLMDGWCTDNRLNLYGVVVYAPDGTFTADTSGCAATGKTLDFKGAIFLSVQPTFSSAFDVRNYGFLRTLKQDPPPIRAYYDILAEYMFRKYAPNPTPT
jgi:hypothetical protein